EAGVALSFASSAQSRCAATNSRSRQSLALLQNQLDFVMPKPNPKRSHTAGPAWKIKWPRSGDLRAWFRTMVQKSEAIAGDRESVRKATLPIKHLAELGHTKEALRYVNRFLRRVPRQNVLTTVWLARLGAEICVDVNDLAGMEKYLAIAEA